MKIKKNITKKNLICTAIMAAAVVCARVFSGISVFNMILFIVLYALVKNTEIEWNEKGGFLWAIPVFGAASVITTWLIQYLLLVQDLRSKISNEKFFLNILCVFFCYMVVQTCTNNVARTCILTHIALMIFAGANHFVYEFRGNELTFGDLKSLSTGLSVASNYNFTLNAQAANTIFLSAVCIAAVRKVHITFEKKRRMRLICISLALLSFLYIAEKSEKTVTETWEQKGTYRNGYMLNFALSIRDSFVDKPEEYSKEVVEALEQEYNGSIETEAKAKAPEKKPTIIAIMDESFADFDVLGNLKTNQPVTPFIDSLSENTIKGYALASVYGAKTPNSEWEFMTGNNMAWLPEGSVAYQQFMEEENAYSIVDTLKKEDYTCVAMHPYYATGWSRDVLYPKLGFEEMHFLEAFDQSKPMRKYVSDSTMFDKIIERYEAGKGKEHLFFMGITMQNHGGYREQYENFYSDVYGTNISYPDVNQYLSLIHQTDLAVEKLIQYFEKEEEPIVICFFGDHQPSLNTSFYQRLNGKGLSGLTTDEMEELYTVPFFIWTNYESESKVVERSSLSFLSTMLLERAGVTLPPYNRFLNELQETIPSMNARAYYSEEKGRYIHYEDAEGKEAEWLKKYQILQYNGLFDKKEKSRLFFGRN